jgi:lipoic acid synthetase
MISERPEVVSHNMETVEPLYRLVRPQARYMRSLEQLSRISAAGLRTKTGFMLGLGETREDVARLFDDLMEAHVHVVTIGQYLQPTARHLEVAEYVHPDLFAEYRQMGYERGFDFVESGPLVRSSYHAERHIG